MKPFETPQRPEPVQSLPPENRSPKPYRSPRLVSYGRLADVTQFGGSQAMDSGPPGSLGQQL